MKLRSALRHERDFFVIFQVATFSTCFAVFGVFVCRSWLLSWGVSSYISLEGDSRVGERAFSRYFFRRLKHVPLKRLYRCKKVHLAAVSRKVSIKSVDIRSCESLKTHFLKL